MHPSSFQIITQATIIYNQCFSQKFKELDFTHTLINNVATPTFSTHLNRWGWEWCIINRKSKTSTVYTAYHCILECFTAIRLHYCTCTLCISTRLHCTSTWVWLTSLYLCLSVSQETNSLSTVHVHVLTLEA